MSDEAQSVLRLLERSMRPLTAVLIAVDVGLSVEDVYACLVRLYDMGLARIARRPGDGVVCGWEAA